MEYRIVRSILFVVPGREIDHFQAETIISTRKGCSGSSASGCWFLIWRIQSLWIVPV